MNRILGAYSCVRQGPILLQVPREGAKEPRGCCFWLGALGLESRTRALNYIPRPVLKNKTKQKNYCEDFETESP